MHELLFPSTMQRYKDKVRFIYKDDPLDGVRPWAMHAAVDANCLAAQSGEVYWTYVDYLHGHGEEVSGENRDLNKSFAALDRIARQEASIGKLDETKLDACLTKQDETAARTLAKEAEALGIDGTPALFIDGERINGAVPEDQVWIVIDRALRAVGEEPPPSAAPAAVDAHGERARANRASRVAAGRCGESDPGDAEIKGLAVPVSQAWLRDLFCNAGSLCGSLEESGCK